MDDLDHSLHIAEEDWSSFYQESEGCCVPQPTLAHPESLHRPEVLLDCPGTRKEDDVRCDYTGISLLRKEVNIPEESIPEETQKSIIKALEAVVKDVARSLSDERSQSEDVRKVPLRKERECWFVTLSLNDNPIPQQKTKTRNTNCQTWQDSRHSEKSENFPVVQDPNSIKEQSCDLVQNKSKETSLDVVVEQKYSRRPMQNEDRLQRDEEGAKNDEDIKQNHREDDNISPNEDGILYENCRTLNESRKEGTGKIDITLHESANTKRHENIEGTQYDEDIEENVSEGTIPGENSTQQETEERTPHDDDIVQNKSHRTLLKSGMMQNVTDGNRHVDIIMEDKDKLTPHEHLNLVRVESEQFDDSVEVLTLESSGSEIYLSADESGDFSEEDSTENQPEECPSYLSSSSALNGGNPIQCAEILQTQDSHATAPKPDYSANQTYDKPESNIAPIESQVHHDADPPRVQTDSDGPRSVPHVVVTPVAESPEAHAQASGNTPCVYAISAFWDEMEKLTINDILQLRMARSPLPAEMSDIPSQSNCLVDPEEHQLTDGGLTDTSDTADSDYFTQPGDSKADRSSWDFSVCDFEEDYWQFLGSRNPSPDLFCKTQQAEDEREGSTKSQTPIPIEDPTGQYLRPRSMPKNKSLQNVRDLSTEDLALWPLVQGNDKKSNEELMDSKEADLRSAILAPAHGDLLPSFPDSFITQSNVVCVYDPEGMSTAPACDDMFFTYEHKMLPSQNHRWKPVPIFSCSNSSNTEFSLPKWNKLFLRGAFLEEDGISPFEIVSKALRLAQSQTGMTSLASGKICVLDKGSFWHKSSNVLPARGEECTNVVGIFPSLHEQQRIAGRTQKPVREGIWSALQQADMCLVCIAFASWVLTSSDPESADAWKAALLANVSALSAIQYLRQTK